MSWIPTNTQKKVKKDIGMLSRETVPVSQTFTILYTEFAKNPSMVSKNFAH